MSTGDGPRVFELLPAEAWDQLESNPAALLIDVRTKAEWAFVGKPDLTSLGKEVCCIAWAEYPDMSVNPAFVDAVKERVTESSPSHLFFICRSGARSLHAANAVTETFARDGIPTVCINVAEGFEGELDAQKKRGGLNGWKARGLPWSQS